jgi:hypothetical protein
MPMKSASKNGGDNIKDLIAGLGQRPADDAPQGKKRRYAELFSNALARRIADRLRPKFKGVLPDETGAFTESRAPIAKGFKRLDVNYSTAQLGLALGISIKTILHRDKKGVGRYSKNYPRVDDELRAEAMDYHVRQPYAVMIGLYFMPIDACDDAKKTNPSSFASFVRRFRYRAGRSSPSASPELFERIFVGLFDTGTGEVRFFDVENDPPKSGRPDVEALPKLSDLVSIIRAEFQQRNGGTFNWAPP